MNYDLEVFYFKIFIKVLISNLDRNDGDVSEQPPGWHAY